jgi:hypothetical protein
VAELVGNDLIVSMGGWGLSTTITSELNFLINTQASTIMHELGHNLGLRHGGSVDTNYKPNYWSVMNYLYQLNGLDADPAGSTAYQRWRYEYEGSGGNLTLDTLPNSPYGDPLDFVMDYSDGSSSALDETNLQEADNIGRGNSGGAAYADWDLNGSLTGTPLAISLNGDTAKETLTDYNDWGNLQLPFARSYNSNSGVSIVKSANTVVSNPITADKQPVAHETPPSARFFEELRRAR